MTNDATTPYLSAEFHYYSERSFEKAREKAKEAIESGDPRGASILGWIYYRGDGVDQDITSAKEYFEIGQKFDDPEAIYGLGCCAFLENDYESAMSLFESAASLGFAPAFYRAGLQLYTGKGVVPDRKRAYEYFMAAHKMGNIPASRAVVSCLAKGYGGLRGRLLTPFWFCYSIVIGFVVALRNPMDRRLAQ